MSLDLVIKFLPYFVIIFWTVPFFIQSIKCFYTAKIAKNLYKHSTEEFRVVKKRKNTRNGNRLYMLDIQSDSGEFEHTIYVFCKDEWKSYSEGDNVGLFDIYKSEEDDKFYRVIEVNKPVEEISNTEVLYGVVAIGLGVFGIFASFIAKTLLK